MGLHQRTRDYLYQEFIRRNYQGARDDLKKALLEIRPDDIAELKKSVTRQERRHGALAQWLANLGPSRKDMEKSALDLLKKECGLGRLAFYRAAGGQTLERKLAVGGESGFPRVLKPDWALKPTGAKALTLATVDMPWAHDLKNQGLTGRHALFLKSGKLSALLAWSAPVEADGFGRLVLELLTLLRGDRPMPQDAPVTSPVPKKKKIEVAKAKSPKNPKAKVLEPSRLLKKKLLGPATLDGESGAPGTPNPSST